MDTHTPGPWYGKDCGNGQGLIISEATGKNVAVAYDTKDTDLIAAAPELLAACKRALEVCRHPSMTGRLAAFDVLGAVIANAES